MVFLPNVLQFHRYNTITEKCSLDKENEDPNEGASAVATKEEESRSFQYEHQGEAQIYGFIYYSKELDYKQQVSYEEF